MKSYMVEVEGEKLTPMKETIQEEVAKNLYSAAAESQNENDGYSINPPEFAISASQGEQDSVASVFEENAQAIESQETNDEDPRGREEFERGREHFVRGHFRLAAILFQRALHRPGIGRDKVATLTYNLGLCNFRMRRYAAAIHYFELYQNYNPERESAQRYLAVCRRRSGAPDAQGEITGVNNYATEAGSIEEDRPSQTVGPTPEIRDKFDRAVAHRDNGNYRTAIYLFEQVRQAGVLTVRENADMLYNLGTCNLRLNRVVTAVTYLEQYLRINPENTEVLALLREARRRMGLG